MTDPGKMRHRITFQAFNGTRNAYGEPLESDDANWTDFKSCYAAIDPVSGREFYEAQQSQSEVTHKLRTRYLAGITPTLRILCGTRKFKIISVLNWEERGESLLILAKELV